MDMGSILVEGTWEYVWFATATSLLVSAFFIVLVWLFFKKSLVWKLNFYIHIIVWLARTADRISGMFRAQDGGWIVLLNFFLIAGIIVYFSRNLIARPIVKLKDAADKVTSGEFDFELPKVKSRNELKELTASLEMLISAFKVKLDIIKNLEKRKK